MKNIALITDSYGGLGSCFANIHAKQGAIWSWWGGVPPNWHSFILAIWTHKSS